MRQFTEVKIVITSSWREVYKLRKLQSLFTEDIGERIVGLTPISNSREGYYRHREVLAYLRRQSDAESRWLAIDDDAEHYPQDAPVLLVDPQLGLDALNTERLRLWLTVNS